MVWFSGKFYVCKKREVVKMGLRIVRKIYMYYGCRFE